MIFNVRMYIVTFVIDVNHSEKDATVRVAYFYPRNELMGTTILGPKQFKRGFSCGTSMTVEEELTLKKNSIYLHHLGICLM